ncbi:MAG: NAD-dependent epimerase/dehydratase family protein [Clostridiales bacterium]|nr:NAD-dependent epimerase/dehydratase family protein [Clostridiales bacterium]
MTKQYNIMILGGSGFIGRNLCRYLSQRGHRVSVFDLFPPEQPVEGVTYLQGDFFTGAALETVTAGQDVVIHALSTINPGNSNRVYMRGYEQDFIQTLKLFELACAQKIRVLFLSSAGTIYGQYDGTPFTESHPLMPINHYGSIKVCVETAMRSFNRQQDGKLFSCRISNPYGPGQDYRKGVGFIDAVVRNVLENSRLEIWGDGNVVRDYIYIEDVCAALEKIMEYEGSYDTFNISTGTGHSQLEILEIFRRLGCEVHPEFLPSRSVDASINIVSNKLAEQELGIRFRKLEDGLPQYLRHLKMIS